MRALIIASILASQAASAQRGPAIAANPLTQVKSLVCVFSVSASVKWENGDPQVQVKNPSGILNVKFDQIDTQDGTARVISATTGAADIIVKLAGWNLHFVDMRPSGSLNMTTVFAQESRDRKLKAVHTRTDYLPVNVPGLISEPDVFQFYGECEIGQ